MKIGDKVSVKDVRRAQYAQTGYPAYFDDGIDIEGVVLAVAHFVNMRALIEFTHQHRKYHVTMYDFELPNA